MTVEQAEFPISADCAGSLGRNSLRDQALLARSRPILKKKYANKQGNPERAMRRIRLMNWSAYLYLAPVPAATKDSDWCR
jgi:hypothetical protein